MGCVCNDKPSDLPNWQSDGGCSYHASVLSRFSPSLFEITNRWTAVRTVHSAPSTSTPWFFKTGQGGRHSGGWNIKCLIALRRAARRHFLSFFSVRNSYYDNPSDQRPQCTTLSHPAPLLLLLVHSFFSIWDVVQNPRRVGTIRTGVRSKYSGPFLPVTDTCTSCLSCLERRYNSRIRLDGSV